VTFSAMSAGPLQGPLTEAGKVALAARGTVCLDKVGELPSTL
jgi:transcriptional regulator with GAF, ATPase, and Fis domain